MFQINQSPIKISTWTDDLLENPDGEYKFGSATIRSSSVEVVINRSSYSLLDWLGDVGGLIDALFYLLSFLLGPFVSHGYESFVLSKFFRLSPIQHAGSTEGTNEEKKLNLIKRALVP